MSRSLVIVSVLGIEIRRFKSCHPDLKNIIKLMFKVNIKAQNESLKAYKFSLPCYGVSENRFFESEIKYNNNNTNFDFGYKHKIKTFELKYQTTINNVIICKIINLETPYDEISVDFESYRRVETNDKLLKLFKEKFDLKTFFRGRLLNGTKRGFSVGAYGLVGFIAINNLLTVNQNKTIILYIDSINLNQGIVSFSQKNIHKKTHKVLLKLASRIIFVFESNVKVI